MNRGVATIWVVLITAVISVTAGAFGHSLYLQYGDQFLGRQEPTEPLEPSCEEKLNRTVGSTKTSDLEVHGWLAILGGTEYEVYNLGTPDTLPLEINSRTKFVNSRGVADVSGEDLKIVGDIDMSSCKLIAEAIEIIPQQEYNERCKNTWERIVGTPIPDDIDVSGKFAITQIAGKTAYTLTEQETLQIVGLEIDTATKLTGASGVTDLVGKDVRVTGKLSGNKCAVDVQTVEVIVVPPEPQPEPQDEGSSTSL